MVIVAMLEKSLIMEFEKCIDEQGFIYSFSKCNQQGHSLRSDNRISVPPKTETLERVAATINRTVMLTCTAQAYPAPQFQWYRRNIPINSDSRITVLSREQLDASTFRSRLQIQGVEQADFGDYVCLVKNSQGNTTKRVSLTVKSK